MTTYGKKKRSLLPFSAFQGEEPNCDQKNNRPGIKMGTKAMKQASHEVDGSTDEVADGLLDDSPHKGDSISIESPIFLPRFYPSPSNNVVPDGLNKPLPPIPMEDLTESDLEMPMHGLSEADAIEPMALISSPVPHKFPLNSTTTVTAEKPIHSGAVQETKKSNAYTTTADATDLGRKLSLLMRESTAENSCLASTMEPSKLSVTQARYPYLRRGGRVYARAKQVITNHLSSSGERQRRGKEKDLPSSSPDTIAGPEYMTDAVLNRERLDRRIAEGANLSNPKIRFLTGDGTIPRKPLPVYDSMKPLPNRYRSTSLEDPFSDERDGNTDISSPEVDEFGFDGESTGPKARKPRPSSAIEPLFPSAQLEKTTSCQSGEEIQRKHQFSEVVSGLAQHPDTDFFSSSPTGYSTPRYRLQAHYDARGRKRLSTVPASSPSVLDFSSEDHSGDESPDLPEANMGNSIVSLKRRTAKYDLRLGPPPVVKKAKREDGVLTAGMGKLSAIVTRNDGPLAVKDKNQAAGKSKIPRFNGRGLKILEVCRGMAPMPKGMMNMKGTQTGFFGKRSSIPTPIKPSSYLDRRASTPIPVNPVNEDSTSLDELQME